MEIKSLASSKNSLLEAIYERYSDLSDLNGLHTYSLHYKSGKLTRTGIITKCSEKSLTSLEENEKLNEPVKESDVEISISTSPRKPVTSISVVLSDKNLSCVGDCEELESMCKNLQELDLSGNNFKDWNEIKKLLLALKKLKFLNLTANTITCYDSATENEQTILHFDKDWPISTSFESLKTLILKECFIDLNIIEKLLIRLTFLNELHLSRNKYKCVNFSPDFIKDSLKILYVTTNDFEDWTEISKLGKSFPNLDYLAVSENKFRNFKIDPTVETKTNSELFKNLKNLHLNKINFESWSCLDDLKEFPNLNHIRIHDIPLLDKFKTEEEKHQILVAHFNDSIQHLNGSFITKEFKETCERKYIRHFMDLEDKPSRYFELESKHGKLDPLADVNLDKSNTVQVKITFEDKHIYQRIKLRQTVAQLKKSLEKFVGQPANKFRIYYIDKEAESAFGHDELKLPNTNLIVLKLKDGDEFDICLK